MSAWRPTRSIILPPTFDIGRFRKGWKEGKQGNVSVRDRGKLEKREEGWEKKRRMEEDERRRKRRKLEK